MPLLNDTTDMENQKIPGSGFAFSATRLDKLQATEYTLVTIVIDNSGSVATFAREMEACVKEIVSACAKSPRADNLLIRVIKFSTQLREVHGFMPLTQIKSSSYDGILGGGSMTALYDAAASGIEATVAYGKSLVENDFSVNGIVFVITDGDDNASTYTQKSVRDTLASAMKTESLESLVSILIGVNVTEPQISQYLNDFNTNAGFTAYKELKDADAKTLARLAQFVSKSISSQSQSLGSGSSVPAQSLTF